MKKVLLLALALVLPTAGFASEVAPGTIEVKGGSKLSFGSTSYKPENGDKLTLTTFGGEVSGLYYVTPSFGVGLEVMYEDTTVKVTGSPSESFSAYTIGPKAAYEVELAPQVAGYGEAFVGLVKRDVLGLIEMDGWGFGVGAGVKYFFSKSVSGNVGLNYSYAKLENSGTKFDASDLSLTAGLSVYFGNGH